MTQFDTRLEFQRSPGVAGFDAYDVDIVSPELPCGAAWLANCLLELGVALWKPWNVRDADAWQPTGVRRFRYAERGEPLRALLPALRCGREFEFQSTPVPRVYHYWPGFYPAPRKTILFVRDPRDALHSAWRRARAQAYCDKEFEAFVARPYFHYPLTFAEYLLLFLRLWRVALSGTEHLIVRYEDYRRDAAGTLLTVCAFLGLDPDARALRRAVAASSFETSRQAERNASGAHPAQTVQHRAGVPFEFRSAFTPSMHAALGGYGDVYEWLNYDASAASGYHRPAPARTPLQVPALGAAMRLDQMPAAEQTRVRVMLHAVAADWG